MPKFIRITCIMLILLLSVPFFAIAQAANLDDAARNCAQYLQGRIPRGTRAALVVIQSENPGLSDFVYNRLSAVLVNGGWFTVVERNAAALRTIEQEMDRHLNNQVSEETELSIGKQLGAQVIISGSFTRLGQNWRLDIKALNVESAQVAAQWSGDVRSDPTWASLVSQRNAGLSFAGDALSARDRQTVVTGLRNAMQDRKTALELDENAGAGAGYGFTITIYMDNPPANPSLIQAEVTMAFTQGGRVLFQSAAYNITETSQSFVARRIAERLRADTAFFNRVNDAIK